jgi:hypothetical protein
MAREDPFALGGKPRNPPRPVPGPLAEPEFFIEIPGIMGPAVRFRGQEGGGKAKPCGADGAAVYWG